MATLLVSVPDVAERLACSRHHVYDLIEQGELPAVRIGARRMSVRETDLEAFIEARLTKAAS